MDIGSVDDLENFKFYIIIVNNTFTVLKRVTNTKSYYTFALLDVTSGLWEW